MSSMLQLDVRNLSLGRRHMVNAYEVKAGIGVIAGNTVWSMPGRLACEVLQKERYIITLTFTFYLHRRESRCMCASIHYSWHGGSQAEARGGGGQVPPGKCSIKARFAQSQRFGSQKKNQNRCHVSPAQYVSKCVCVPRWGRLQRSYRLCRWI